MKEIARQLVRSQDIATRVAQVMQKRVDGANKRFTDRVQAAYAKHVADLAATPKSSWEVGADWTQQHEDSRDRGE